MVFQPPTGASHCTTRGTCGDEECDARFAGWGRGWEVGDGSAFPGLPPVRPTADRSVALGYDWDARWAG